jgi:hypothetical protein
VNKIMEGLAEGPVSTDQQYMLLRMATAGLEALAKLPPAGQLGKETEFAARYPFLENSTCRNAFLVFALKVSPSVTLYIRTMCTGVCFNAHAHVCVRHEWEYVIGCIYVWGAV